MKYPIAIISFLAALISCTPSNDEAIPQQDVARSNTELFDSLRLAIEEDLRVRKNSDSLQFGLPAISIENQIWMKYNLAVDTFNNGDDIMEVNSTEDWKKACDNNTPAWCCMSGSSEYNNVFGKLYNQAAIMDPRGLTPSGWRIPNTTDWQALVKNTSNPVCSLKSADGWMDGSISNCDNPEKRSEFQAYPAGMRTAPAMYGAPFEHAYFWARDQYGSSWAFNLTERIAEISTIYSIKYAGMSVRYVHD